VLTKFEKFEFHLERKIKKDILKKDDTKTIRP